MSPTSLKLSRIQKKRQVTIPVEIRQRLGLVEGDLVAFIETDAGILLAPQTVVPTLPRLPQPPPARMEG